AGHGSPENATAAGSTLPSAEDAGQTVVSDNPRDLRVPPSVTQTIRYGPPYRQGAKRSRPAEKHLKPRQCEENAQHSEGEEDHSVVPVPLIADHEDPEHRVPE